MYFLFHKTTREIDVESNAEFPLLIQNALSTAMLDLVITCAHLHITNKIALSIPVDRCSAATLMGNKTCLNGTNGHEL